MKVLKHNTLRLEHSGDCVQLIRSDRPPEHTGTHNKHTHRGKKYESLPKMQIII